MKQDSYPDVRDLEDPEVKLVLPGAEWRGKCRAFQRHGGGVRCGNLSTIVYLEWYDDYGDGIAARGFCQECAPGVGTSMSWDELEVILVLRL